VPITLASVDDAVRYLGPKTLAALQAPEFDVCGPKPSNSYGGTVTRDVPILISDGHGSFFLRFEAKCSSRTPSAKAPSAAVPNVLVVRINLHFLQMML
jgi:hypothetical protein